MGKKKKSSRQDKINIILLVTAILNLLEAIVYLIHKA